MKKELKGYDRAPNVVHANDLDCAKSVMEKIRFSEIRVKNGKGSKPRKVDYPSFSENWKNIRWL